MTFKEKLITLRKINGMTQDDLAKKIGVSRQSVYKWESGVSYPEIPKLLEIKALFAVSLDDLFDESFEISLPEKKKRRRVKKEISENKPAEVKEETAEKEEQAAEPTEVKEEAPVKEEPKKETPAPEKAPEKKIGFFGRLFGRK